MARLFNDAASDNLETSTLPVSAAPLTMACFFRSDDITIAQDLMAISLVASSDQRFRLIAGGNAAGDPVRANARTTASGTADTTTGYSANTWHHAAAVFASTTSRTAYIDGGSKGTNTTSLAPSGMTRFNIGVSQSNPVPSGYLSGDVCEAGIWNAALTDAEILSLAQGMSPRLVRPGSLVGYWRLLGNTSPEVDLISANNLTVTGAVKSPHYRVFMPSADILRFAPIAGAGGAALTGTSGTGQVGTVGVTKSGSAVLTGTSGTGQAGNVTPSISVTRALTSVDGTGAVGSTGVSVSATRALSGAEATGAVGTVTTGADVTTSLTSVSATGQVGTVGVAKSGSAALTGLQATGQAGSVAASLTVTRDLTGLASTGEIGSVGLIVSATRSLTGVESTGAVGTVDTGNNAAVALVGIGGVGQVGSVAFTQYGSATLSGAEGTGAVGSVSVAGASLTLTDGTFFQGVLNSDIYLQNTLTSDIYLQGGLQ